MKENRAQTLSSILRWEGSELNTSPSEPGGASKYGISVSFLTDYRRKHGLPAARIADVSELNPDIASAIYAEMLLDPLRFDDLPSGVDYRLADISTNLGMTGGPTLLQLCLGMFPPLSGVVDDATITKVMTSDQRSLIWALSAGWIALKHQSPNWGPSSIAPRGYGPGWTNRNNDATQLAITMIGKTI